MALPRGRPVGLVLVVVVALCTVTPPAAFAADTPAYVTGGVMPVRGGSEVMVSLGNVLVTQPTGTVATNAAGKYVFSGVSASTLLDGTFVNLTDSCGTTNATADASGNFVLGPSPGTNCTGTPTTRAARTATYYTGLARQLGRKWLPENSWTTSQVPLTVNIDQACNAVWDASTASMRLYRAGGGCTNSGESADAVLHVWRGGLDDNNANPAITDGGTYYGFNDAFAVAGSRDPCVAPGFLTSAGGETAECPTAIRDVRRPITTGNVQGECGSFSTGVFGGFPQCESHLISGSMWDLAGLLVNRHGVEEGWNQYEKLLLRGSDPVGTGYQAIVAGNAGCSASGAYLNILAADDDNANLVDGTPNADLISQAFTAHGIGCTSPAPVQHVAACPTLPSQPVVTAADEFDSIRLTWPEVPGATGYRVFRRIPATGFKPFLPVGSQVVSPTFLDTEAYPGLGYEYQVTALNGSCASSYGTPTAHTLTFDIQPPSNPTMSSPSHTVSVWSTDATVDVSWSGADDAGGSGVVGYSFAWSTSPSTTPDTVPDAGAASTGTTSPALAGGTHWFHLRTVDAVDNVSNPVHLGPFQVDTAAPGGVAMTTKPPVWTTKSTLPLQWTATDTASGIASYDVNSRSAPAGGSFGPPTPFRTDTQATSGTFAGQPGNTYCFSADALDHAGNESVTSPEVCTALPVKASSLVRSGSWKARASAGSYFGSYFQAKKKGAALAAVVRARRIAVVVTTCPGCGKLVVKLGNQVLKTIQLDARKTKRLQVITVATFPQVRTGTVRLVVKTSGKPVRVEGLGISGV